jgi:hypothetical protein
LLIQLQYAADHKELEAKLESLKKMCEGVKEGSTVAELSKDMQDYETMMLPHLLAEEEQCLPLMRAYFTPQEIAPIVEEIIGNGPKVSYHRVVVVKRGRKLPNQSKHLNWFLLSLFIVATVRLKLDPLWIAWALKSSARSSCRKREFRHLFGTSISISGISYLSRCSKHLSVN